MLRDDHVDVAMVAPYPRLGVRHGGSSGVASYTANLVRALDEAGVRVTVVAPTEPGEPAIGGDGRVPVHRCFNYGPFAMSQALRAARRTGAAVVHVQHEHFLYGGPGSVPGLLAGLAARRRGGSATVVTMHQVVDPSVVTRDYAEMHRIGIPAPVARIGLDTTQRAIARFSDSVVVHERAFTEIIPGARTIPHGTESAPRLDSTRSKYDLGLDERPVALCFGFLAPYKGLEIAGDAARIAGDAVQVVFAGGAHPRLERRHRYAAELQARYGDCVRFTGYVPDADVHRWFAAADVAVLPYPSPHATSGPLALAIAHGTPVLASAELARICGLPPETAFAGPDELARRLRALAAGSVDDPARQVVARLGAERSWDAVARQHREIYAELYDFTRAA